MKLVPKLTLAFIGVTASIFVVTGVRRIRRESANYRADRDRDLSLVAGRMADAASTVWRSSGATAATAMIASIGEHDESVRVRWVCLDGAPREASVLPPTRPAAGAARLAPDPGGPPEAPGVDCASLARLAGAEVRGALGVGRRYAYVPVQADGAARGALEVSGSLAPEQGFVRRTALDTLGTIAVINALFFAVSFLLGFWLVARPTRALVAKARRVGQGDFGGPLALRGGDEFGELAAEMNAMCRQLVDVHARVQAESAARLAAMEQLRHADRLTTVGKLASGIAHELGTPINVIEARASMIVSGEAGGELARQYAAIVVDQCDRVTKTIGQLLAFARRRGAEKTKTDLREMARQSALLLEPMARQKRIALRVAPVGEAVAAVDAMQLQQALTNLVVNAIQASAEGDAVDVTIDRGRVTPPADHGGGENEYARISVSDVGAGIPRENIDRVFEPFFTTKDVGDGTGLGLSVAYGIVRDHGGWIAVESEMGRGSRFTIYLPEDGAPAPEERAP
jgi:two-component system NtrC family sensor kinase